MSFNYYWKLTNNQDGKRPASIEVQLLADGAEHGDPVTLNQDNNWSYTWEHLDKYKDGSEITYTVKEVGVVQGYTVSYSADTFTITNTHTPEKTSKTVSKVWEDSNNQDGIRPASIEVQLLADGAEHGDPVTLNQDNNWGYTWEDLDKYKDGREITYTVKEVSEVPDYTVSYSADTFTITNTYTPGKTSKTVSKVWEDSNNLNFQTF